MGVVARSEGNHDTFVSYDGTAATWAFLQWTFTSGRLQSLLQSFKAIADGKSNLYDKYFAVSFEPYGFKIENGKFVELSSKKILQPETSAGKRAIDDICMGRHLPKLADQKNWAMGLARVFVDAGQNLDIANAQIEFAKGEFKRALQVHRDPLGKYETLDKLLEGSWDSYVSALFFNLWQNSPAAAYKLFIRAKDNSKTLAEFEQNAWQYLNNSKFANWSYANPENKSPRIARIQPAIKEFYGIDLKVVKPR
jgi:hypothetical protein